MQNFYYRNKSITMRKRKKDRTWNIGWLHSSFDELAMKVGNWRDKTMSCGTQLLCTCWMKLTVVFDAGSGGRGPLAMPHLLHIYSCCSNLDLLEFRKEIPQAPTTCPMTFCNNQPTFHGLCINPMNIWTWVLSKASSAATWNFATANYNFFHILQELPFIRSSWCMPPVPWSADPQSHHPRF